MFKTTAPRNTFRTPGTIDLEISNPVILLNEIARRYESTERIVMEYVDNALDDAEALYQENDGVYPYPIEIELRVDTRAGEITILDNCRGMTRDQLERVVRNVGESQKIGQPWVNGRFGFGVHAFRAAAQTIAFRTKHALGSHFTLELQRDQGQGIREAQRSDDVFPTTSKTGTQVLLSNFDREWFQNVSAVSIQNEIERHFERLLARPGLSVRVGEDDQPPHPCASFDYEAVPGIELQRRLDIRHHDEAIPVNIYLKVADAPHPAHRVAFFSHGRRVAALAEVKSFLRKSSLSATVWDHPNLIGMIEVGEVVQPKLFRDDFVRSRRRQLLYEAITDLEAEIRAALQPIARGQQENNLTRIEYTVQQALERARPGKAPAVRLVSPGKGHSAPAYWEDGCVCINMDHPAFGERLGVTQQGLPRLTDRMNAYLAGMLSLYDPRWRQDAPDAGWSTEQILLAQVDYIFEVEAALRKQSREADKTIAAAKITSVRDNPTG